MLVRCGPGTGWMLPDMTVPTAAPSVPRRPGSPGQRGSCWRAGYDRLCLFCETPGSDTQPCLCSFEGPSGLNNQCYPAERRLGEKLRCQACAGGEVQPSRAVVLVAVGHAPQALSPQPDTPCLASPARHPMPDMPCQASPDRHTQQGMN